jgi:type II secretory pathway component HofQ
MRTSLQTVLRKILSRIPIDCGATFVIRKDHIEISTLEAVSKELGIPIQRLALPLVYEEFVDQPLPVALQALANAGGLNIVLDPAVTQAGPAKELKVTAQLHNVPVETALRVVVDMADAGLVRLDNVLYVTTQEKAARLRAEEKEGATNPAAKKAAAPSQR